MVAKIYYAELWGRREGKYQALFETDVNDTAWMELTPNTPFYFFVPREEELRPEYEKGWKVTDIFPVNSVGFVTARDSFAIDFDKGALRERIIEFRGTSLSNSEVKDKFKLKDTSSWNLDHGRQALRADKEWEVKFTKCLYRPFDFRHIYFSGDLLERPLMKVMRHMLAGNNIGLCTNREVNGDFHHILCSRDLINDCTVSLQTRERTYCFPLYLYPAEGEMQFEGGRRRPNLNPEFIAELEKRLGVRFSTSPSNPLSVDGEGAGGEVPTSAAGEVRWRTSTELWLKLKPLARQMRREPTEAEEMLWQRLRNHQLLGFKFRRQHSIERFIVDFYCARAQLAVEVEGQVHQYQQEEDRIRQAFLESQGLRVLRFPNEDVLQNLERVIQQISNALTSPSNPLSVDGEGAGGEVPATAGGEVPTTAGGEVITPEDIFNYAYAVFHSPTYRSRYAEFLKIDFPRLPLTSDKGLFKALAEKGAELVALHLMESPALDNLITGYPVAGSNTVDKVSYDDNNQRVYINKTQYFEGVPPEIWEFHIGGYQVCQKWLKDRKGRTLTYDELTHYQKVMVALKETIRLMAEIDDLVPGWPLVSCL